MTILRSSLAVLIVLPLAGCSLKNLKEPEYIDLNQPAFVEVDGEQREVEEWQAPIQNLKVHYLPYVNGASTNKATLSSLALFGAGVSVIGAATHSGSEVYKASAAIIATAFGFEEWGNFKQQRKVYQGAVDYLLCAENTSLRIMANDDRSAFATRTSELAQRRTEILEAYTHANVVAELRHQNQTVSPTQQRAAFFEGAGGARFEPTIRDVSSVNLTAQNETDDLQQALVIVRNHPARLRRDVINLQSNVSDAIANSAFDTQKAVASIISKKAPESSSSPAGAALMGGNSDALANAHAIIDANNEYEQCLAKTVQPASK